METEPLTEMPPELAARFDLTGPTAEKAWKLANLLKTRCAESPAREVNRQLAETWVPPLSNVASSLRSLSCADDWHDRGTAIAYLAENLELVIETLRTLAPAFQPGRTAADTQRWVIELLHCEDDRETSIERYLSEVAALIHSDDFEDVRIVLDPSDPDYGRQLGTARAPAGAYLAALTRPIRLVADGYSVPFGAFWIIFQLENRDWAENHVISPVNPNWDSSEEYSHPHVSGTQLCLGEAYRWAQSAADLGLVSDLFRAFDRVLHGYNAPGSYRTLAAWADRSDTCRVCGEVIEAEELVHCALTGVPLHASCARVFQGSSYLPAEVRSCTSCGEMGVGGFHRYTSGIACCLECEPSVRDEVEAALRGTYACPMCGSEYDGDAIDANRIELGRGYMACRQCCSVTPVGFTFTDVDAAANWPRRFSERDGWPSWATGTEPLPIQRPIRCGCGAMVMEGERTRDMFDAGYRCEHCDPSNLGFSVASKSRDYLDGYMQALFAEKIDPFTIDFVSVLSADDIPTFAELWEVGRRLRLAELGRGGLLIPSAGVALQTYVDAWNAITAPVGYCVMSIIHPESESFYDEEIRRRFRR